MIFTGRGSLGTPRPLDVDFAFRLIHQILHVRAQLRVDRNAFSAGDIAHNVFAPYRVAAFGAIHENVVGAFDVNGQIGTPAARLEGIGCGLDGTSGIGTSSAGTSSGATFCSTWRAEVFRNRVPRTGLRTLLTPYSEATLCQVVLRDAPETHTQPAGLFFQRLLADLHRLGTLGRIDDMPDAVPGARRLHYGQPVATRLMARLGQNLNHVAILQRRFQRLDRCH